MFRPSIRLSFCFLYKSDAPHANLLSRLFSFLHRLTPPFRRMSTFGVRWTHAVHASSFLSLLQYQYRPELSHLLLLVRNLFVVSLVEDVWHYRSNRPTAKVDENLCNIYVRTQYITFFLGNLIDNRKWSQRKYLINPCVVNTVDNGKKGECCRTTW